MIAILALVLLSQTSGNVDAPMFTAHVQGFYLEKTDAGTRVPGFRCQGTVNGVPCVSSDKVLEMYGHVTPHDTAELTVCDVELYAEWERSAGCIFGVGNGETSNKVFVVGPQGQTYQQGEIFLRGNNTRVVVTTANRALELRGNLSAGTPGYPGIWLSNAYRLGIGEDAVQVLRAGPVEIVARVDYGGAFVSHAAAATASNDHVAAFESKGTAGALKAVGQTRSSFPTCSGTEDSVWRYASDEHRWYFCDSDAWQKIAIEAP